MFIFYNGVQLLVSHITSWADRAIYSEDGSERLYRHVSITAQVTIHPKTIAGLGLPNAASAPEIILALKRRLLTPRCPLVVQVGDNVVLRSPPLATAASPLANNIADPEFGIVAREAFVDARNGPIPLYADVTEVRGTKTLLGVFSVETWLVDDNLSDPAYQSALISHRWQVENTLDHDYLSTRIISGKGIFRGDWLYSKTNKGDYRQVLRKPSDYLAFMAPPTPDGYRRISVKSQVSSDGLVCAYTIVDQEVPTMLKRYAGVSRVEAVWRSGHSRANIINAVTGGVGYSSIAVRVWGLRDTNPAPFFRMGSRDNLIAVAILIAQAHGFTQKANVGDLVGNPLNMDSTTPATSRWTWLTSSWSCPSPTA
jgi:hypothetical protein